MSASPKDGVAMADAKTNTSAASAEVTDKDAPENAVPIASSTRKEPPPEKPQDVRRRSLVILSFWLIVLFLGLPIWWATTTIYRASLPLSQMTDWAEGKACRPVFPLRISIQATSLQEQEAQNLLRLTQHTLDDLNDFSGHHLRLQSSPPPGERPPNDEEDDFALTIRLEPGEALHAELHPHLPFLDITYPPSSVSAPTSSSSSLATYIANQLRNTFAEEQAIISYLLSSHSQRTGSDVRVPPDVADTLSKRTTRSVRYAPTYHLTFSLFTSGPAPSSWAIEEALDTYMRPVLDVLSPIHNFTVDTQVQLYASPGVASQELSRDELSSFINAAEWPLSPSIGGAPTINFVVFVGPQTVRPDASGAGGGGGGNSGDDAATAHSWLIPQWGAVHLLAPGPEQAVGAAALREPMLTFAAHLLALLGTPSSGSLPLRLSTLGRVRSADLLLRASSTLGSLARLSRALPGIAIPGRVLDGVRASIDHLGLACAHLGGAEGLRHARVAEEEAERAFFEKSMVGQLYFPDEHKIAVYLPLLGPVGVPLIMGLLNELRAWRKRRGEAAGK